MSACLYGFRILGATREPRRLVDADAALAGYAACDERAQVISEAYLSTFTYDDDFRDRADGWGVVNSKGFDGICSAPFVWWDIDCKDDLEQALRDARRLAKEIGERFQLADNMLLTFFSGSKGFHLGLPTALWQPEPSIVFHRVTRCFAEIIADDAAVAIDVGVYDKVRAFRAPNSRHPKTGLHKRHFSLDDLNDCSLSQILQAARNPMPFDLPAPACISERAAADWQSAVEHAERQAQILVERRAAAGGTPRLNRLTIDFIRNGAEPGNRHRILYSAAANLAEFDCPPAHGSRDPNGCRAR